MPTPPEQRCFANRHQTPATFVTYNTMVAACKSNPNYKQGDELIFWGSEYKLANMNNRGVDAESDALDRLETTDWIIPLHDDQRRKQKAGTFDTNKWRVVEHAEWAAAHGDCPPAKYVKDGTKWKLAIAGKLPKKWAERLRDKGRQTIRDVFGVTHVDDSLADLFWQVMKSAVTENSTTVTVTENSTTATPAVTENSTTTVTENSTTTVTENSTTTVTENSVTIFALELDSKTLPSNHPTPNVGGWEEVFKTKAATLDVFIRPKDMVVIRTLVESEEHGVQFLMLATDEFKHRNMTGSHRPAVVVFMEELEGRFTKAKHYYLSSSDWRMKHDPAYREAQEKIFREQSAKDTAFFLAEDAKKNICEAEIEELLAE